MSTTASGFSSTAAARPSARTRRPSASVLSTSTVFPPRWVITSDGRCALPDGMFSATHSHPVTLTGSSSVAAASTVCSTAAAPAMSSFIVTMPLAGLIDSPPESNVIPLPTIATERLARAGAQLSRTRRGGRTDPCPTATRPPYPPAAPGAAELGPCAGQAFRCDRRQGDHVRLRRAVDQAGQGHGDDEV